MSTKEQAQPLEIEFRGIDGVKLFRVRMDGDKLEVRALPSSIHDNHQLEDGIFVAPDCSNVIRIFRMRVRP